MHFKDEGTTLWLHNNFEITKANFMMLMIFSLVF